ncbi:hypothetical protein [Deefgea piscis]|uniref:hypothetical protein n=1 Tax=Deefgea piscis TaxID=2739061 RepID=UPI001C7FC9F7|nr:hypothetical protein [Deefgea piscis]QZA80876.1 hypothetical protein K4H25_15500 [Deefgea piscis]
MSKYKATLPRTNPPKGTVHYVVSFKSENARVEETGLMPEKKAKLINQILRIDHEIRLDCLLEILAEAKS